MKIDKQFVDTHGQDEVAFGFCHLLGFELMPRLKNIYKQTLYRPKAGEPHAYPNLKVILTRPINWELIKQQYHQMIKYATAMRLGTAETEAILRRFTRTGPQHPTYLAFLELGRAVKTIFLCRYLESKEDFRALTPLIYSHVTPYGTFQLDLTERMQIEETA
jgi:TnpA family transposase